MKTKRDWKKIIEEWSSSGLSITDYCKTVGVPQTSLYKYRKKVIIDNEQSVKHSKSENPSFVDITNNHLNSFIPVNVEPKIKPLIRIQTTDGKLLEIFL